MKIKIIAAALTVSFTGAAHSETAVTLYGIVDAGIGYQQTRTSQGDSWNKTRDIGLINGVKNGNRWGLKGSEDLGNGTSAIFQLESGFDMGNGKSTQGGRLFGRQAYIGLTGPGWGTLTLGRVDSLAGDTVSALNPFGVSFKQAGASQGAFGSSTFARMENAIKYTAPEFSGIKFGVAYAGINAKRTGRSSLGDVQERNTSHWLSLGGSYSSGPLTIAASYDRFRTNFNDSNSGEKIKGTTHMWNIFSSYDLDVVKLYAGYGQVRGSMENPEILDSGEASTGLNAQFNDFTRVSDITSAAYGMNYAETAGYRQQAWLAGLTAPVGDEGKIMFSYQGSATKNTDEVFRDVKGKLSIFSVGYEHKLSKRTTVYAIASYGTGKLKLDEQENVKLKSTLVGIGLNHRF